jgi:hypothetical protein
MNLELHTFSARTAQFFSNCTFRVKSHTANPWFTFNDRLPKSNQRHLQNKCMQLLQILCQCFCEPWTDDWTTVQICLQNVSFLQRAVGRSSRNEWHIRRLFNNELLSFFFTYSIISFCKRFQFLHSQLSSLKMQWMQFRANLAVVSGQCSHVGTVRVAQPLAASPPKLMKTTAAIALFLNYWYVVKTTFAWRHRNAL